MSDYGDDSRVEKIVNAIDDVWGALDVVNKNALTSHERYVLAAVPIVVAHNLFSRFAAEAHWRQEEQEEREKK